MSNTLSSPRALLEAQTQSAQHVYSRDPFIADMGQPLSLPSAMTITVRDTGVFVFRPEKRLIEAVTECDEYGRPLTEHVLNGDRNEATTRQWYYETGEHGAETIFMNGGNEVRESYWQVDDATLAYTRSGCEYRLVRRSVGNKTVWVVADPNGTEFERTTYGSDGKIQNITTGSHETNFYYDQQGRLARQVTSPGNLFIGNENLPNAIEYDYKPSERVVMLRGLAGYRLGTTNSEVVTLEETRYYDDAKRPTAIESRDGPIDLGQRAVRIAVEYPTSES